MAGQYLMPHKYHLALHFWWCNLLLLLIYLLILLTKWFLFYYVHLLSRFIFQMVLLSGYLSFSVCSALNPDCLFAFEWRNFLGIWKDTQIFVFWSAPLFPYSSYYWRCDRTSYLNWEVMVKIISSCLCSPVFVQSAMRQDMSHFTLLLWLTRH